MKFHDKAETWEFGGGDPKFLHTNVIFQDGDNYFWTQLPKRGHLLKDPTSIDRSLLQEIPPEHIWPLLKINSQYAKTLTARTSTSSSLGSLATTAQHHWPNTCSRKRIPASF